MGRRLLPRAVPLSETPGALADRVAAVFVNFHSGPDIIPRARALNAAGITTVVADNSGEFDDRDIPTVALGENVGFGAACNRAVASLSAGIDTICLHNPDVDFSPADVLNLAGRLRCCPTIGAVAPAEMVGSRVYRSGYRYPSAGRELALSLRNVGRLRRSGDRSGITVGSVQGLAKARPSVTSERGRRFPSASMLLIARAAFDAVGGFDERFFLYVEDLDLVHRLREANYEVVVHGDLVAIHHAGEGSAMGRGRRELLRWLGVELFMEVQSGRSWRRARRVHRLFLRTYAPAWPELADAVRHHWAQGRLPSDVLEMVRPLLKRESAADVS